MMLIGLLRKATAPKATLAHQSGDWTGDCFIPASLRSRRLRLFYSRPLLAARLQETGRSSQLKENVSGFGNFIAQKGVFCVRQRACLFHKREIGFENP